MGKIVLLFLLAILTFHFVGTAELWYFKIWWLDIPMHLLGGAWLALFFAYVFVERFKILSLEQGIVVFFILALGFTALIGVLWEFYEYGYDVFLAYKYSFGEQSRGVFDTLKDLFNDLLGASFVSIIYYFSKRRLNGKS